MKVFVYYNLHRKLWSVKALQGPDKGRVIHHSTSVLLQDAEPRVSQAGRMRVVREGRKNVHAGIVGTLVHLGEEGWYMGDGITYNPYRDTGFVYRDTHEPFERSQFAYFNGRQVEVVG